MQDHHDDAQFACIGQLRKGSPKQQGRMGRDLTYFRAAFFEGEDASAARFRERYGNQPTEIEITFPFDEPWRVWDYGMEAYTGSGVRVMLVNPDDNSISYWFDPHTGEVIVRNGLWASGSQSGEPATWDGNTPAYTYVSQKGKHAGQQKIVLPTLKCRLRVMVPALQRVVYMNVITKSWNDKRNITSQLNAFYAMRGSLKGLPLILRRRPQEILSSRGDGRRLRETKSLISIEATEEFAAALFAEMTAQAMPGVVVHAAAPVPDQKEEPPPPADDAGGPAGETEESTGDDKLLDIDALALGDGSFHDAAIKHFGYSGPTHIIEVLAEEHGHGWAKIALRDLWVTLEENAPGGPPKAETAPESPFFGLQFDDKSFQREAMEHHGFSSEENVELFLDDEVPGWTDLPVGEVWEKMTAAVTKSDEPSLSAPAVKVPDFVAGLNLGDDSFYQKAKDVFGFDDGAAVAGFLLDELGKGYHERHSVEELWLYIDAAYRESSEDDKPEPAQEEFDIPF